MDPSEWPAIQKNLARKSWQASGRERGIYIAPPGSGGGAKPHHGVFPEWLTLNGAGKEVPKGFKGFSGGA